MNTNILISIFASGTDSESRLVGLADVAGMMRGTCQLPPIVTAKLHGGDSLATLTARYRAALAEALGIGDGRVRHRRRGPPDHRLRHRAEAQPRARGQGLQHPRLPRKAKQPQ